MSPRGFGVEPSCPVRLRISSLPDRRSRSTRRPDQNHFPRHSIINSSRHHHLSVRHRKRNVRHSLRVQRCIRLVFVRGGHITNRLLMEHFKNSFATNDQDRPIIQQGSRVIVVTIRWLHSRCHRALVIADSDDCIRILAGVGARSPPAPCTHRLSSAPGTRPVFKDAAAVCLHHAKRDGRVCCTGNGRIENGSWFAPSRLVFEGVIETLIAGVGSGAGELPPPPQAVVTKSVTNKRIENRDKRACINMPHAC